jgi:PhzF family phenazine biosynthesis protein
MNQLTDKGGNILPIVSREDWEQRRAAGSRAMQEVMGPLPGAEKRCSLEMETIDERDCGSYVRRFIAYRSEPNSRVPAYLLIPKSVLMEGRRVPAILCLHGASWFLGHRSVANPDNPRNHGYAAELAERGYVVLAPAYPMQGNYFPRLKELGYQSGTMKAIWDNIRGVDLLETLPWVSSGRYGVLGMSQGGYNAAFTAAFEPRLKIAVISVGFDSFQVYKDGDLTCWGEERHMPRLLDYPLTGIPFDFHDVIGAIAPRRCFISSPLKDFFKWQSAAEIVKAAGGVYRLYDAADQLTIEHPDCGHEFPDASRQRAYRILDQVLEFEPVVARSIPMYQVDAFADRLFAGNPAAVCILKSWLTDDLLQSIAAENNLSETAFLVAAKDGFELRWFTPTTEVALCGHATLASAYVLFACRGWSGESIAFYTRWKGTLTVARRGDLLEMDFPVIPVSRVQPPAGLARALGVACDEIYTADEDLMIVLPDEATVRGVAPDLAALAAIKCRGIIVTARGVEADFVSRFFAPRYGIPEDPVTGSAHCALAPFWAGRLGKTELVARQVSKRGGELRCSSLNDRVSIAGRASLYLTGTIVLS